MGGISLKDEGKKRLTQTTLQWMYFMTRNIGICRAESTHVAFLNSEAELLFWSQLFWVGFRFQDMGRAYSLSSSSI